MEDEKMANKFAEVLKNNVDSKNALKVDNIPFEAEEARKASFKAWKEAVSETHMAVSAVAVASKQENTEAAKAGTDAFFTAYKKVLLFLQESPELRYVANDLDLKALLPHAGTFRKAKGTETYDFLPSGFDSFRKQLEKTIGTRLLNRTMKTAAEVAAERKAKKEAEKAAKKAKREAEKATLAVTDRPETIKPEGEKAA